MKQTDRHHGFTLIELMMVIAIIAIIGALATVGYQKFTDRARGAEIIEKYDALRTGVTAMVLSTQVEDCAVLVQNLGNNNLTSDFATLGYGFEATIGGFRPVLTVCAQADPVKPQNVKVAREAYEILAKNGVVEKNPVLTDSVVSFALRLTDDDVALCKTTASQTTMGCGQGQPVVQVTTATQPSAQPPVQPTCPAGQQMMTLNIAGSWQRGCQPVCARGQQLNLVTKQCDVDHGFAPQSTATTGQAQLATWVRQQVQVAEQKLAQQMASVTTLDEAIAQTMAATQGLPSQVMTQSIPGSSATGRNVRVNCKLPEFPDGACKDQVAGNFCTTTGAANADNCNIAVMCPKTLGVCQGVTAEMRRIFDASMQRIANDWFAQHPGCSRFGETGC